MITKRIFQLGRLVGGLLLLLVAVNYSHAAGHSHAANLATPGESELMDFTSLVDVRLFQSVLAPFPPLQTVIETILVFIDGPVNVEFQEAFCNGSNFTIYDNNAFIATVPAFNPRYCGINTSSYQPIVFPLFSRYVYAMPPGGHNLTVVVANSPLVDGSASLRITFKPTDPIIKMDIIARIRRTMAASQASFLAP